MTSKKAYLILQTVLCVLLAVILICTAAGIYRQGLASRAEHPLEAIYTREIVAEKFALLAPLLFTFIGMSLAGILLDVRGEKAGKAVKDVELIRDMTVKGVAEPRKKAASKMIGALQAAVLIAAIALIIAGTMNGGARDVLYKAAKICTECIGLG